jgi:hypothetical protein
MRLGGIYALEWITTSSPGNRRTVANILTVTSAGMRLDSRTRPACPDQWTGVHTLADLPRLEARPPTSRQP